ncbi:MAG: hypothetical protein HUK03_02925 [Bacteroidaceae bacterium]|nr:hypothetical protein [Bacteroidaceae bacterium]
MTLHIFNPENDMALADGKPGYTPPAIIRQMRHELAGLPYWWAADDDVVWDGESPVATEGIDRIQPWGWSPALCHQLRAAGVAESLLPTDERLRVIRRLSHRGTAVEALRDIMQSGIPGLVGESRLCHSADEAMAVAQTWQQAVMKAPWSSSGKGLMRADAPNARQWAERIIRQQGSVAVEAWQDRQADLAMEFWLEGGVPRYEGLSLFYTNDQGAYQGNWVAPEGEKMQWLASVADPRVLGAVQQWWMERLRGVDYEGPVGVDMLLTRDGMLCPCVEVNWRMTMGLVSVWMGRQQRYGRLIVEYTYGHYSAEIVP